MQRVKFSRPANAALSHWSRLAATDLAAAASRLHAAFDRFEAHAAPLRPHFAYGELDKAQYTRAHLLHLANHAQRIALA